MAKTLSPREEEIIELCVQGLTNEGIAERLGLSVGTVNTYWLRIRIKVGGSARTDTVVRVIQQRAEEALSVANVDRSDLAALLVAKDRELVEARAKLALLNLAMNQFHLNVWVTDHDLKIKIVSSEASWSELFGASASAGKSVQEVFGTTDLGHPALEAHSLALQGVPTERRLGGQFANILIQVMPLWDELESKSVIGCIAILRKLDVSE
jgi:DNA-binding CsgD family transcriptional regulator